MASQGRLSAFKLTIGCRRVVHNAGPSSPFRQLWVTNRLPTHVRAGQLRTTVVDTIGDLGLQCGLSAGFLTLDEDPPYSHLVPITVLQFKRL